MNSRNYFITVVTTLLFVVQVFAGRESGGGDKTKDDVNKTFNTLMRLSSTKVLAEFPWLLEVLPTYNRTIEDMPIYDKIELKIVKKPIEKCKNSQNPILCARFSKNVLVVYSNKKSGWESLSEYQKLKFLLHELLWWHPTIRDSKFEYSTQVIDYITKIAIRNDHQIVCNLLVTDSADYILSLPLTSRWNSAGERVINETFEFNSGVYNVNAKYTLSYAQEEHMSFQLSEFEGDGEVTQSAISLTSDSNVLKLNTNGVEQMGLKSLSVECRLKRG